MVVKCGSNKLPWSLLATEIFIYLTSALRATHKRNEAVAILGAIANTHGECLNAHLA